MSVLKFSRYENGCNYINPDDKVKSPRCPTIYSIRATEEARAQLKLDKWVRMLFLPCSALTTCPRSSASRHPTRTCSGGKGGSHIEAFRSRLRLDLFLWKYKCCCQSQSSRTTRHWSTFPPTPHESGSSRAPRFILLETWTLGMNLHHRGSLDPNTDISPPVIYKHGIILFRSLFSLLRVLPSWKFYKRLKRRAGSNGHLGIQLRVRGLKTDRSILGFGKSQLLKALISFFIVLC